MTSDRDSAAPSLPVAFMGDHPALVLSLATAAAVAGKIFLAARGDVEAAKALISGGVPDVLLGVVLLYAPVLAIILTVAAFWWSSREGTAVSGLALTVTSLTVASSFRSSRSSRSAC